MTRLMIFVQQSQPHSLASLTLWREDPELGRVGLHDAGLQSRGARRLVGGTSTHGALQALAGGPVADLGKEHQCMISF